MIFVGFDMPDDKGWRDWHAKAIERAEELKKNFKFGKKPTIDPSFYKDQRQFLVERFNRKCAYCETRIDRSPIDVEHYRPKGAVTNAQGITVKVRDEKGKERAHPGYYWLAYDWKNLLPSCQDCNRKRYHEEQDAKWGKETCFPVESDRYVWSPSADIAAEKPLLINPRFDDPENHLEFLLQHDDLTENRFCIIKARDDRGKETIKVFGLNDENLAMPRLNAFNLGYTKMKELWDTYGELHRNPPKEHLRIRARINSVKKDINDIWRGKEAYTAFVRLGIRRYISDHELNIRVPLSVD
jgi:uncharacterized protein (TIGR02646 family)